MAQTDLAEKLELGKAALGGIIDRLEANGSIARHPDPVDRRVKRIYLTPSGKATIKEMQVLSHNLSEEILSGLNNDERMELYDLLMRVKKNLNFLKGKYNLD